MNTDQYTPPAETAFAKWRREQGFSLEQARAVLGKSRALVYLWDKGVGANGKPAIPPTDTLILMQLIADGAKPSPYPLSAHEQAAVAGKSSGGAAKAAKRPAAKKKAPRGDQSQAPCIAAAL